ncbi:PAS domain S-box protein [Mesorhizobium sp.]|jgi:PAS domain S-box-containing protein|uniref:PAS domain-containing hybrid sensor histidine kinase/response regulator n=1 Tax=Mesorhizobium sp. TaxID=1871066 RepID=UPI0035617074
MTTAHESFDPIFDALDCGVIVVDQQRRVTAWNAWIAAASGIAGSDAVGTSLQDLFPSRPLGAILAAVSEALEAGASSLLTPTLHPALLGLRTRAGQPMVHSISVRPIGAMGAFHCMIQIADVTGATRREAVLRQRQNARYDAVMESAAEAILTLDGTGVIQGANAAAEALFEIDKTSLIGLSSGGLFVDSERWSLLHDAILAGGEQGPALDVMVKRRNGTLRYLEVSISRWSGGAQQFTTAFLRDVTDRLSAEIKLKTLNETLEQRVADATRERDMIWRVSQDLFVLTDLDLTCQSVNPAWCEHLGYPEGDVAGTGFEAFVHPDDVATVKARLAIGGHKAKVRDFDIRMRARDGKYIWYSWQFMPHDNQYYAAGRDITARRVLEDQLRQSQKMEAVGQLTGGIAHDFNNMLAVVISGLNLIQRRIERGEPGVPQLIAAATEGAHKAATLTQRLLAFSRQQPLSPEALDVNRMVVDMSELLRRTLGEHVNMETILQDQGGTIIADRSQLENVLVNLAVNARDAMPSGGTLTIETSAVLIDESTAADHAIATGEYILISVTDTGTGMSPDVMERAFDPFFTTKGVGKGTGLGLSQVFGFVKQSGGYVSIQSQLGQGTAIRIVLPRHSGAADQAQARKSDDIPNGSAAERILVVEDEASVRELTVQMLEELGYSVMWAASGADALVTLKARDDFSLLLTDVVMPGMNGRELADNAAMIRPSLKVLYTSGYARDAVVSNGIVDPNIQLLQKPATLQNLAQKVRAVLDS